MTRWIFRIGAALATITMWSCGGGSGYDSNVVTTTPSAVPTGAVTVSVVGSVGTASFVPNPVSVAAGGALVWKNNDATTHHIVLDNGSADLGDLPPGATSGPLTITTSSEVRFHCTLHPSMVGSINGLIPPPASDDPYYPTSLRRTR